MALTDQPYLPLYVDDWMNNNKLKDCTPSAHGLMISIMCIMHKSDDYGTILLKQKYKQTVKQEINFAYQLARLCSFEFAQIEKPLQELLEEEVLTIEGDILMCKRMVKDAETSIKRASAGKKGGTKTQSKKINRTDPFALNFAKANIEANTVNGIVIENVNEIENDLEKFQEEKNYRSPEDVLETLSAYEAMPMKYSTLKNFKELIQACSSKIETEYPDWQNWNNNALVSRFVKYLNSAQQTQIEKTKKEKPKKGAHWEQMERILNKTA